jgi:hypothetical protein
MRGKKVLFDEQAGGELPAFYFVFDKILPKNIFKKFFYTY